LAHQLLGVADTLRRIRYCLPDDLIVDDVPTERPFTVTREMEDERGETLFG
jgi:hypothetical protein